MFIKYFVVVSAPLTKVKLMGTSDIAIKKHNREALMVLFIVEPSSRVLRIV